MLGRSQYREGEHIRFNVGTEKDPKYIVTKIESSHPAYHREGDIDVLKFNLPGDSPGLVKYTVIYSEDPRISKIPVEPSRLEKLLERLSAKIPSIFSKAEESVDSGDESLSPAYD